MVFTDAHDTEMVLGLAKLRPDAICWDLEDSTPLKLKDQARKTFPVVAKEVNAQGIKVMARINPGMEEEDLDAVVCPELHCAQISKTEGPEDVIRFCEILSRVEKKKGLPDGYTLVRPVVETAAGVKWAYEIAAASPRIAYMGGVHGSRMGDLGVSLGYRNTKSGVESWYLRAKVLVDVRTAGVPFPVGGGGGTGKDVASRRESAEQARDMGYQGGYASAHFTLDGFREILDAIHDVFTPPIEDINRWLELLPQLEEAAREGTILLRTEYGPFDTACLKTLHEEIDLARRIGMIQ
jgi:citrate lyase subunit beta/citryl-CoA lyase